MREAIKVLQAQGVVTSQTGPGRGTRVEEDQGAAFGRMLSLHVSLNAISFTELTETRVILERAAAESAARLVSSECAANLITLAESMGPVTDPARFNQLDIDFHLAIAAIGDNRLIRDMTMAIRQAVGPQILEAELRLSDWERLRQRLMSEHEGIAAAIAEGRERDAAELSEQHIRGAHTAR